MKPKPPHYEFPCEGCGKPISRITGTAVGVDEDRCQECEDKWWKENPPPADIFAGCEEQIEKEFLQDLGVKIKIPRTKK